MAAARRAHPAPDFPADINRETFGHWLSGFTDGEGCFLLYCSPGKPTFARARFAIALRSDDADVLNLIHSFFGCGGVGSKLYLGASRKTKPQRSFFIDRSCDLVNYVIPHFDKYPLRAKKARDFAIWSQGVQLLAGVAARPRRSIGSGGGTYPAWTAADKSAFLALTLKLKAVREFAPIV